MSRSVHLGRWLLASTLAALVPGVEAAEADHFAVWKGGHVQSVKFGEPRHGITAKLAVWDEDENEIRASIDTFLHEKNAPTDEGLPSLELRGNFLRPQKVYMHRVDLTLNQASNIKMELTPIVGSGFVLNLPYVPDVVQARVSLTSGVEMDAGIRIGDAIKARLQKVPNVVNASPSASAAEGPRHDAAISMRELQSSGPQWFSISCLSSPEEGPIREMSFVVNLDLSKVTDAVILKAAPANYPATVRVVFSEPVYKTYMGFDHSATMWRRLYGHELLAELHCDTVKGQRISASGRFKITRPRPGY